MKSAKDHLSTAEEILSRTGDELTAVEDATFYEVMRTCEVAIELANAHINFAEVRYRHPERIREP